MRTKTACTLLTWVFYFQRVSLEMKSHDTAKANIIASETIERKERWVCAKSFIVGSFLVLEILREYFVLPPEYISQRSPCLIELNAENVAFLIKGGAKFCNFLFFITAWLFLEYYFFLKTSLNLSYFKLLHKWSFQLKINSKKYFSHTLGSHNVFK